MCLGMSAIRQKHRVVKIIKQLILPALALLLIAACSKKKTAEPFELVKGDVAAGITAGTPVDSVFTLFNRLGLKLKKVMYFTYAVPYPLSKADSLNAYLNTKPYIDSIHWKANVHYDYVRQQVIFSQWLFDMDSTAQQDWLLTLDQLKFTDLNDSLKSVFLQVPEGTELYWVTELQKYSIIRWAEVNHINRRSLE